MNEDTTKLENSIIMSDYEFDLDINRLDDLDLHLSKLEEKELEEVIQLEKNIPQGRDLLHDMIEAAKEGAMNYLNSFTDTMDTFDHAKNPNSVNNWDKTKVDLKNPPANKQELKNRTIEEANKSPFDKNAPGTLEGMSPSGQAKMQRYLNAYQQRTKSITALSKDGNKIRYKTVAKENFESLSGLRGYRVGPVVKFKTIEDTQQEYQQELSKGSINSPSNWLFKKNMEQFDTEFAKQFGFKDAKAARNWREDNHLTVHEGPNGMFLVPRDVHDATSHSGYRSEMVALLKGKITKAEFEKYNLNETKQYVLHEAKIRGTRAVKGVGMSIIKDLLKTTIIVVSKETYLEFNNKCEDKFIDRIKRLIIKIFNSIKTKCKDLIKSLWANIKGSLISEFLTMLNDFIFKTAKNIFKIVRTMWSSIVKAVKIIISNKYSWQERIFEATKILTAGLVGVLGFSLNEILDKGLTSIGIPFASFIAECLTALISSILSSLVLVIFDSIKKNFIEQSPYLQISLKNTQIVQITNARVSLASIKTDLVMENTLNFFDEFTKYLSYINKRILHEQKKASTLNTDLSSAVEVKKKSASKVENMVKKYTNDYDF